MGARTVMTEPPCGVLVVDKPLGMTSHDVVSRVRRVIGTRRVGHAGTLDPDASGVLVLCVGEATRLLEYLQVDAKTYEGTISFGVATETDDAAGAVIRTMDASRLTRTEVARSSSRFVGTYMQRVPAYSAVHVNGKRAYEWARQGIEPVLPERPVTITQLEILDFEPGSVARASFRVSCSKGTYIRSLCRDWGEALGLCAHMSALRRTVSGSFTVDGAVSLEQLARAENARLLLRPLATAVQDMPQLHVPEAVLSRLTQGQAVTLPGEQGEGSYALFDHADRFWLVAKLVPQAGVTVLRPHKVLARHSGHRAISDAPSAGVKGVSGD